MATVALGVRVDYTLRCGAMASRRPVTGWSVVVAGQRVPSLCNVSKVNGAHETLSCVVYRADPWTSAVCAACPVKFVCSCCVYMLA